MKYIIFNPSGEQVALCKYAEDAAALIAFLGDGATIRSRDGFVRWSEGKESQPAAESFDFVAETIHERDA